MKLTYYPETDTLYSDPLEHPGVDADEISSGTVLNTDADRSFHRRQYTVNLLCDNGKDVLNAVIE